MSKTLRLSEKWFRRGLWLVALVFASFLIGLGSLVVGDLPRVETYRTVDDFIDPARAEQVRADINASTAAYHAADRARDTAQLDFDNERARYQSARDTFDNWVATRQATARPDQDVELMARTQELDRLKKAESEARGKLEQQRSLSLQAQQALSDAQSSWDELSAAAYPLWQAEMRAVEMRVFLYRLALTLPLLLVAGWLFVRQRKGTWWPFVWGFIFFAAFAFFVELVPYLPDYGGYVRYLVGIVVTVLIGRWAILALQRYLERQQKAEALPAAERRVTMTYDAALTHLAKGVCPGCERPVDLKDGETDFCPHCGIGLYAPCCSCGTRKSAFTKFCFRCGSAQESVQTE